MHIIPRKCDGFLKGTYDFMTSSLVLWGSIIGTALPGFFVDKIFSILRKVLQTSVLVMATTNVGLLIFGISLLLVEIDGIC